MNARRLFVETFGREPETVARTPGRVNLIGEHTDYNGGMVLPTPIARSVEVAIGAEAAPAPLLRVVSAVFGDLRLRRYAETPTGDWSDYALGAVKKAIENGALQTGLSIAIDSDLPHGAGLSSSAAIIVCVLRAIYSHSKTDVADAEIARQAKAVENDFIGVPCGIMDQMAVAAARPGEAIALDTSTLRFERVPIPKDWRFAVFHSGVTRELTDGRYGLRRAECEAAARRIGAEWLCRAEPEAIARLDGKFVTLFRRARHATSEHARVLAAATAMRSADARLFGKLMNQSHASMRDDFDITTPLIDRQVEASRAAGAIGARMTGGGFGGCIVSLVPNEAEAGWRAHLISAFPAIAFVA